MVFENLEQEIHKLYKFCLKLSGSPWIAEDLVQVTMLKVYKIKKYEPERRFAFSFLCTVAKNHFIDEKRKMKETISFNEDLYGEEHSHLEYNHLIDILLSILPMKQAMLITLKDVFGYSSKEIASMLRVSDESIKTALHRSRKKLKLESTLEEWKGSPSIHKISIALSNAIRASKPMQIFYYYRLLEAQSFQVKRDVVNAVIHVIDPDGNILEITT